MIMLGEEDRAYWGNDSHETRCTFFVGVSRAQRRLVVTTDQTRDNLSKISSWRFKRSPQAEFMDYVSKWQNDTL